LSRRGHPAYPKHKILALLAFAQREDALASRKIATPIADNVTICMAASGPQTSHQTIYNLLDDGSRQAPPLTR